MRFEQKTAVITGAGSGIGEAILASKDASYITGIDIVVDGGWLIV